MADKQRSVYFNAPGLRSQEFEIAPSIDAAPSKRKPLISAEDVALDSNLLDLDNATRTRNKEFQSRLDEIWQGAHNLEAKLRTEANEAAESILEMKEQYSTHIGRFRASLLDDLNGIFNKFDHERIPAELSRLDSIDSDIEIFVRKTVPESIEQHSGQVSRQLRRSYEMFGIEQKKEAKREDRLVMRASKHMQKSAQSFLDEDAFLSSIFHVLENDVVEYERRGARLFATQSSAAISASASLHEVADKEAHERTQEDVVVLDTVIETQQLLQDMVLMHFGTKEFEHVETTKLNERMQAIKSKSAQ